MTASAVVIAARPDGRVDLEFAPARSCAGCAGTCLWKRLQHARIDRLPVAASLEPGTEVSVAIPARRLLVASVLLYGLPLAAILTGAATGWGLTGTDAGTLIGGLGGVAVVIAGFGLVRGRLERATLAGIEVVQKA